MSVIFSEDVAVFVLFVLARNQENRFSEKFWISSESREQQLLVDPVTFKKKSG